MGIQRCCHAGNRMTLLGFIICCSVFSGGHVHGASSYRLSREGYSSAMKALLIAIKDDPSDPQDHSWLAMYDEATGSIKRVAIPGKDFPADFAWAPGHAAFVVTHIEGLTFFQEDDRSQGYRPKAIRYPTNTLCLFCSWSPNGQWLAVTCLGTNSVPCTLGLYKFDDKKLVKTSLKIGIFNVVWGHDGLLYAAEDKNVLTIELKAGEPRVVRAVPLKLKEGLGLFYGMFADQPLFLEYDEIRLGDKTLVTLDKPAKYRVIATETILFVSTSPKQLSAFDRSGHEISKANPGRLIKFGSVKDPNTVYAWADSELVRVCLEKGSLHIETVCDLHGVAETKGKQEIDGSEANH